MGARCCATACEAQPASSCGTTGECTPDGTACARWPDGTTCSESSCADGRFTAEGSCSGSSCRVPADSQCPGNVTCADGKVCKGACGLDADCPEGLFCHQDSSSPTGTVCRTQANGEACENDVDCALRNCVQGICCNEACTAPALCQGKAAACINSNCSTQPNAAIDDDRACNGFGNPAHRYACSGPPSWAHLYVICNGATSQSPSSSCGPSGTSGCVKSYNGGQRSDVYCGDGTTCHATYSGGSYVGSCY